VLRVAGGPTVTFPKDQSGRKELAAWIASKDNPLTARVYVNRAWHWLFGRGLVATPDNFGTTGDRPTHPELLDHLAADFAADWSVKRLVRGIVLSRAYRQSSAASATRDPDNALFGRANRRRLEAECIRDAMLAASGRLTLDPPNGPTFPAGLAADYGFKQDSTRRSVYLPAFRNAPADLLAAFDPADSAVVTGRRATSTVAPQALALMNSPFVAEQAEFTAARLTGDKVRHAYRLTLGRDPTSGERAVAGRFLESGGGLPDLVHALFASADFRYVD
jgi:hypothetical protein